MQYHSRIDDGILGTLEHARRLLLLLLLLLFLCSLLIAKTFATLTAFVSLLGRLLEHFF
jgi:hypothetical protein